MSMEVEVIRSYYVLGQLPNDSENPGRGQAAPRDGALGGAFAARTLGLFFFASEYVSCHHDNHRSKKFISYYNQKL
jgi:hypothetical protein